MTNAIQTDNRVIENWIKGHLAELLLGAWEPDYRADPDYIAAQGLPYVAQAARVILQCRADNSQQPYIAALEAGGQLRTTLEDIARNHRPSQQRIDARRAISGAMEQFVNYMEDLADKDERDPMPPPEYQDGDKLGIGEFEQPPLGQHVCQYWTYWKVKGWSNGKITSFGRSRTGDDYHNCPACLEDRAVDKALETLREAHDRPMFYGWHTPKEIRLIKQRGNKRQNRARKKLIKHAGEHTPEMFAYLYDQAGFVYCELPQEDGRSVLIHNDPALNDKPFPNDRAEAQRLLVALVKTPDKRNISHSEGFGKEFQNRRGDGRKKYAAQRRRVEEIYERALAGLPEEEQNKAKRGNKINAESDSLYVATELNISCGGGRLDEVAELLGAVVFGARKDRARLDDMSPDEMYARMVKGGLMAKIAGGKKALERFIADMKKVSDVLPTQSQETASPSAEVQTPAEQPPPPEPPPLAYLPGIGDF